MSFISRLRRSRQHRVSILSAYLVHPFPLRGTSPRWEACHWIRGSRSSPMNPVPLPPQGETRALRIHLSVSYGMISILLIGSLRSPPPIRLRRTAPHPGDRINRSMLSCRDMAPLLSTHSSPACGGTVVAPATKGGSISSPAGRLYGFPRAKPGCPVFAAKGGIKNGARRRPPRQRARSANQ